ncbi:FAD-dependent oxidoreductase [Nocardia sp. NPDC052278]|uniref:FAD-dependent oxidoreductase n=1 Tax=unclassified Nocardia TaxID=2637762 RepID=UPI0036BF906E
MGFRVIVIGAGLGGLGLAQGLRQAGIEVVVYERDSALTARRQGYRLHIDSHGRDALVRLLPPHLQRVFHATAGLPNPRFTALNHRLERVFTQVDDGPAAVSLAVDRLVLRQLLLAGIEDAVEFGKELRRYEIQRSGRVIAHLADGDCVDGDVLVAADGVNSAVRQQYLSHARIVDTGVRQLYGMVPLTDRTRDLFDDDMSGVFTAITGPDRTYLGVAPVAFPVPPQQAGAEAGLSLLPVSDYMTCSFGARREWFADSAEALRAMNGAQLHAIMTAATRDWHPRVREIVAHCQPDSLFALPLRTSVPIDPWPTTPVTLLGDAIHAMSPAAGSGACTALRDAARLTVALIEARAGGDLIAALRAYETEMIDYGFAAVRAGAIDGQRHLGQDPLPG